MKEAEPVNPDVVIAGAGLVGLFAARFLLLEGLSVTVYEAGYPGSGASGSSEGAVLLQTKKDARTLELARRSMGLYDEIAPSMDPDVEYRKKGSLLFAETEEEIPCIERHYRFLSENGVSVHYLEGAGAIQAESRIRESVTAALWCPSDASVNPLRLVAALCEQIGRTGGRIAKSNPVRRITSRSGRVLEVESARESASPGVFINACGAWAGDIAKMMGSELPLFPQKGQILVTEPIEPLIQTVLISASYIFSKGNGPSEKGEASSGCVLDQTGSGSILIGSSREEKGFSTETSHGISARLAADALRCVPALGGVRVQRAFSGIRPASRTGKPIIGPVEGCENAFVATGHGGDGVALAPVTGLLLRDMVLGYFQDGSVPETVFCNPSMPEQERAEKDQNPAPWTEIPGL